MAKKYTLAGREYVSAGGGGRSSSDLNGRGIYIERRWIEGGAVFCWTVDREWMTRYANGQALSWESAAQDANEAFGMMEKGLPSPPTKLAAGRPSQKAALA